MFIEDMKPMKLYNNSTKLYLPTEEKNKKKGSVVFLLSPDRETSDELMNIPYMINNKTFESYYMEKDINMIINEQGELEPLHESKKDHLYFYHLVPKGSDISKGIYTLQYLYDNKEYDLFNKYSDKYRNRMVNGWNIYPGRDPKSLTNKEIIVGLVKFREEEDGANTIYLFRYPPYTGLGKNMKETLSGKDMYRIDLMDPDVAKCIKSIDYGYVASYTGNDRLDADYYQSVTPEEYFSNYNDNSPLLFATLNHISIVPKDGIIPKKYWTKVKIPNDMLITEQADLEQLHENIVTDKLDLKLLKDNAFPMKSTKEYDLLAWDSHIGNYIFNPVNPLTLGLAGILGGLRNVAVVAPYLVLNLPEQMFAIDILAANKKYNTMDGIMVKDNPIFRAPVYSINDGVVIFTNDLMSKVKGELLQSLQLNGNCVIIKHSNVMYSMYCHLDSVSVKFRQKVKKGDIIGKCGHTGNTNGRGVPHLHFQICLTDPTIAAIGGVPRQMLLPLFQNSIPTEFSNIYVKSFGNYTATSAKLWVANQSGVKEFDDNLQNVKLSDFKKYDSFKITNSSFHLIKTQKPTKNIFESTSLNEACKDVKTARKFVSEVDKLAKKYDANYFIVTDGASGTRNNGNPAVKNARDSQIEWEKRNNGDPDEDWVMESIIELNNKLNTMKRGMGINGTVISPTDEDWNDYRLPKPAEFLKNGGGNCWDYTAYEAYYFKKNFPTIDFETYYIVFENENVTPTHTFLVFKYSNKYYYFESSYQNYQGIWEADSVDDIVDFVMYNMHNDYKKYFKEDLIHGVYNITQYDATSSKTYGMMTVEFIEYCNNARKYNHKYNKNFNKPERINGSITEAKLSSKDRKGLEDKVFGLPKKRKYPMPDEEHVRSAIKFFNHVDAEDERELASNIKKKMKQYGISNDSVGKDNRLRKYLDKPITEADLSDIEKTKNHYTIKDEKGTIASSLYFNDYKLKDFDWILIADMETKPEYRGQGLATKLLNELYSDTMRYNSDKGLYLFVKPDNKPAVSLYKKLGFKFVKKYKLKDGEYDIMCKGKANIKQFDSMNFR